MIDDPVMLDVVALKRKAALVHGEFMFARSMWKTPDMAGQGRLLTEVGRLVDAGTLRTTLAEQIHGINAQNLRRAHERVESGRMRGKIVLEGF